MFPLVVLIYLTWLEQATKINYPSIALFPLRIIIIILIYIHILTSIIFIYVIIIDYNIYIL